MDTRKLEQGTATQTCLLLTVLNCTVRTKVPKFMGLELLGYKRLSGAECLDPPFGRLDVCCVCSVSRLYIIEISFLHHL